MVRPELGTKRACVACNTKFYDLLRSPAICPKCGTEQPVEQPRMRRPGGNVAEERRPKKPAPVPEEVDVEVEGVEEEAEEEMIEDSGELEDDTDTIGPDIEVEPDADETER